MKNLIISLENLPREVLAHIEATYPHGFYHETFEFEIPGKDEVYEALRATVNGVNYMIKLNSRKKEVDMSLDRF